MDPLFDDLPSARKPAGDHLPGALLNGVFKSIEQQATDLECYETDPWAAQAILNAELLTSRVLDPCCGTGVLTRAAQARGYWTVSWDIAEWGFEGQSAKVDFLKAAAADFDDEFTVFMNPPFSHACAFVEKAIALGARKIVCFQRWAWFEGDEKNQRRQWWDAHPPQRVYLLGNRATCWRFDIPPSERKNGSSTAHGWFVWEAGQTAGPVMGRLYRDTKPEIRT